MTGGTQISWKDAVGELDELPSIYLLDRGYQHCLSRARGSQSKPEDGEKGIETDNVGRKDQGGERMPRKRERPKLAFVRGPEAFLPAQQRN